MGSAAVCDGTRVRYNRAFGVPVRLIARCSACERGARQADAGKPGRGGTMRSVLHWALIALACGSGQAGAQSFASKPVRIIVAFPAGGGTDIIARLLAPKLTDLWGQQVIVDNRPGASGIIGTELAAKAPADGHTLFMGTMGNFSVNKHLFPKMNVDPIRDFVPVTQVVAVHFVMLAHPSLPAKNVRQLIALAMARPGQLTYGSSGAGGAPHLAGELLKKMAAIDIVHVPYKGSAPSAAALMGGETSLGFDSIVQNLPHIRSGKFRALAVLGKERSAVLPDVPTVHESGVPGYDLTNWFALALPAGAPAALASRIAGDVAKALALSDVREKIATMGATPVGDSPRSFGEFMRAESDKWAKLIAEAGIRAQ
jgi:tripartite-type tricarboxylate transporter receptor subunit TctC